MAIGGISGFDPKEYFNIGQAGSTGISGSKDDEKGALGIGGAAFDDSGKVNDPSAVGDDVKHPGRKSSPADCETCKRRKYQDGSDESDVSFQSPTHIDPSAAGAAVRAHEQEHVMNAYEKAKESGGKVVSVGVSIHTSVCPECGRTYVSGGLTTSCIAYPKDGDKDKDNRQDENNPYARQKDAVGSLFAGGRIMNTIT